MSDRKHWETRLRQGFAERYPRKKHQVVLPSGIAFQGQGNALRMVMKTSAIERGNMQSDAAAFEAWALALHGYAGAETVELEWDAENLEDTPHAWRFHFRAEHFLRIFGSWFTASRRLTRTVRAGENYLLNVESRKRAGASSPFSKLLRERKLEDAIVRDEAVSGRFKDTFELTQVGQQLPVGIFLGKVSKRREHSLSPRGSAAIDIWGTRKKDELHIFELKAFEEGGGKKPLGIVSELFFYSMVMRQVQGKVFTFDPRPNSKEPYLGIPETVQIRAWLLAPSLHPLIEYGEEPILSALNAGFRDAGEPITFGRAHIGGAGTFKIA